jgi:hypothetical protein
MEMDRALIIDPISEAGHTGPIHMERVDPTQIGSWSKGVMENQVGVREVTLMGLDITDRPTMIKGVLDPEKGVIPISLTKR